MGVALSTMMLSSIRPCFPIFPFFPGVSCSTVYAIPPVDGSGIVDNEGVLEIPRQQLKFVNKLGEGQFGEVIHGRAFVTSRAMSLILLNSLTPL